MREYWVVIVTDPDTGRERRFRFPTDPQDPEKSAADAWACWAKATHNGLVSRAEHVKKTRAAVPV